MGSIMASSIPRGHDSRYPLLHHGLGVAEMPNIKVEVLFGVFQGGIGAFRGVIGPLQEGYSRLHTTTDGVLDMVYRLLGRKHDECCYTLPSSRAAHHVLYGILRYTIKSGIHHKYTLTPLEGVQKGYPRSHGSFGKYSNTLCNYSTYLI